MHFMYKTKIKIVTKAITDKLPVIIMLKISANYYHL